MTSARTALTPWIRELAQACPAPGGGAAAGVLVGIGAALTAMVAGYSTGDRAGFLPAPGAGKRMQRAASAATELASRALDAADEDAAASAGFAAAFRLPEDDATAKVAAVVAATAEAARTSAGLGALALEALAMLDGLGEEANPIVLADVAVAAAALGAALRSAAVNVEVNLVAGSGAAETDAAHLETLRAAAGTFDAAAARADALVVAVRSAITSSGT